jgi:triacylglycerol lipase
MTSKFKTTAVALLVAASFGYGSAHATYTQTKFPIVLVHGIFGFDNIGPVEYFYGIPTALRKDGARVYLVQVSAANSHEVRGEQLLTQVKQIIAATGAGKVNIIGHSQGSPTARYVASVAPQLVASVTSVNGVNKGSAIADIVLKVAPPGSISNTAIASAANGISSVISFISNGRGLSQDSLKAVTSLSTAGTTKFNAAHPAGVPTTACGEGAYSVTKNGHRVNYYSWGGGSAYTNALDIVDPFFALTSLGFGGAQNDGMVSVCSQRLGRVIRADYKLNHMDVVNQTVGITNLFETDPVSIFRAHANRLKLAGL